MGGCFRAFIGYFCRWQLLVMLVYGWRDQTILNLVSYRFQHKNPEDVAEVPGGFVSDCNKVTDRPMCSLIHCVSLLGVCLSTGFLPSFTGLHPVHDCLSFYFMQTVRLRACVRVCMHACVRACIRACATTYADSHITISQLADHEYTFQRQTG